MKTSLGLVGLPERTVEHDFVVLTKYQEFTAEILRLALLGITAIGYIITKTIIGDGSCRTHVLPACSKMWMMGAMTLFGVASLAALAHRYFSTDSMTENIDYLRRANRRSKEADMDSSEMDPVDKAKMDAAEHRRDRLFERSNWAVRISAAALGFGACAIAIAFATLK